MSKDKKTAFSIKRFLPESDSAPHWERYDIETEPGMTVLDGLHRIREQIDATLSWRYSCRMGVCGSCAMIINGKPGLACNTQVHDISEVHVRLEPVWNFSVVKDLVTDLSPMFDQHRHLKPWVIRSDTEALQNTQAELIQSPAALVEYLQFSYCIKCAACVAACPTVAIDPVFAGPMPLTAAHRYNADSRDDGFDQRKKALTEHHGVSHCHYAGECSRVCPKGVDPAKAIQLMKRDLVADLFRSAPRTPAAPASQVHFDRQLVNEELRPPDFTVPRKSAK